MILVYKRVTALAGHTSRVAELLEQVSALMPVLKTRTRVRVLGLYRG